MSDLKRGLSEAVAAAFAAAGLPAELGRVTPSDRPDLADFQCNGALPAAKVAKRDPREIACRRATCPVAWRSLMLEASGAMAAIRRTPPGSDARTTSPRG